MQMTKVYLLQQCGSCRNAVAWLNDNGIAYEALAVREQPPSITELQLALDNAGGDIRKLLNTSSQDYRDAGLKDRLDAMAVTDVFALMQANGNLVKRPFVVHNGKAWAGFKPDLWAEHFN